MGRNFIYFLAEKHRALLVAVEHRFYGKSYPTADKSLENLLPHERTGARAE
ncbi:hypothetical protein PINS_up016406 [Pythium insidiosum]|nr:hypothetical protein PINS_up016406 [Pythium insidiosum]